MISIPPTKMPISSPMPRPIPRPIQIDKSCVLYYDFINSLATGKTLDESGNTNHGAITGAIWKPDGLSFDGLDDKVTIPYDASLDVLDGNNPFTLAIWFKFDVIPSVKVVGEMIFSQNNGAGTGKNWVQVLGSNDKIGCPIGPEAYHETSVVVQVDTWYFMVIRFDGTNIQIFVDDVLEVDEASAPDEGATGDYHIGTKKTANANWFEGTVSEVALFNRALTTLEGTGIYELGKAKLGI